MLFNLYISIQIQMHLHFICLVPWYYISEARQVYVYGPATKYTSALNWNSFVFVFTDFTFWNMIIKWLKICCADVSQGKMLL